MRPECLTNADPFLLENEAFPCKSASLISELRGPQMPYEIARPRLAKLIRGLAKLIREFAALRVFRAFFTYKIKGFSSKRVKENRREQNRINDDHNLLHTSCCTFVLLLDSDTYVNKKNGIGFSQITHTQRGIKTDGFQGGKFSELLKQGILVTISFGTCLVCVLSSAQKGIIKARSLQCGFWLRNSQILI